MKIVSALYSHRAFVLVLFIGLVVRFVAMSFAFNFRENTDILRYRDWGRVSFLYGLADTYKPDHISFGMLANNQPPGSLYVISSMYYVQIQAAKLYLKFTHLPPGSVMFLNGPLTNAFLRLPSILADLGIAIFIYYVVYMKRGVKQGLLGSSFFLFNPIVLYNSAFWGQMDSVNNIFFIGSLFCLWKKRFFSSVFLFLLSLYIKASLAFIIPIYFLFLLYWAKGKRRALLFDVVFCLCIFAVFTLPISPDPIHWLYDFYMSNAGGEMQHITAFALNGWWLIFKPHIAIGLPTDLFSFSEIKLIGAPLSSTRIFGISLNTWGILLWCGAILPFIHKLYQRRNMSFSFKNISLSLSVAVLLAFLLLPRMHERYMFPVFPLLAVVVGLTGKLHVEYIIFSILHMMNLYLVWHPYMVPFLSYHVMNNIHVQWGISLSIVLVSVVFYRKAISLLKSP